jgi:iron complex outermembrane receptor protein
LAYSYKKLAVSYQFLFNGYVYTATDHHYFLKEYQVSNLEIATHLGKNTNYQIGFQVLNLWNANYQSVPQRPLPGRNYTLHLTLKF